MDSDPRMAEWQAEEELSPPGGDLPAFPAWANGEPGLRGRVTGVSR